MSLEETIKAAREYLAPDKVDCVVYHHPCSDGTGAVLSWHYFHGLDTPPNVWLAKLR